MAPPQDVEISCSVVIDFHRYDVSYRHIQDQHLEIDSAFITDKISNEWPAFNSPNLAGLWSGEG